jgi:hypothetical protein
MKHPESYVPKQTSRASISSDIIMKHLLASYTLLVASLLVACDKGDRFFLDLLKQNDDAYYGEDRTLARSSMENFIKTVEENRAEIESRKMFNYHVLLGDSWLKLSFIYQSEGRSSDSQIALEKATDCFDRTLKGPKYLGLDRSKRSEALQDMIRQVELKSGMPGWKKKDKVK